MKQNEIDIIRKALHKRYELNNALEDFAEDCDASSLAQYTNGERVWFRRIGKHDFNSGIFIGSLDSDAIIQPDISDWIIKFLLSNGTVIIHYAKITSCFAPTEKKTDEKR